MLSLWVFWCCCFWLMISGFTVFGNVVLISSNFTLSFDDIEANFASSVKSSGICGRLYAAESLDACSPLTNKIVRKFNDSKSPFVLITRGGCSFVQKVRKAQAAGFKAAIVYDNEDGDLVAMAGNSSGIKIHAVFVSKASGEELAKYAGAGAGAMELWIVPSFENSVWSIKTNGFLEGILPEELMKLLSLASSWGDDLRSLNVVHLSGTMTNEVYRISWPTKTQNSSRTVLGRLYGEGVDLFFNREDEIRNFELLSMHGYGSKLLGQFREGRVEEFIHARAYVNHIDFDYMAYARQQFDQTD